MQQWFTLSDPAMEESLHDIALFREFELGWPDAKAAVNWNMAMRPGKRAALDKTRRIDCLIDQVEHIRASIRAKVELPFRVIKRQFGHIKVRYRGSTKNTAQLSTLFALSNLWMARRCLLGVAG